MSEALSVFERSEWIECRAIVRRGLSTFYETGQALFKIRDKRLYREEYSTWEDYCRDECGKSKTHINRLIDSSSVVQNLTPIGVKISTESQARELTKFEPERQRQVWQAAVDTAPNGQPTAAHIQETARQILRQEAIDVGLTPQQEAAADLGAGWYKNMHKHWVFYNSLRDHGGIAKLARKWSKEVKQHTLTELETVRDCMNECIAYFKQELDK